MAAMLVILTYFRSLNSFLFQYDTCIWISIGPVAFEEIFEMLKGVVGWCDGAG